MVSTDYLLIECAGKGQITPGRSLLKLLGAKIDVGKVLSPGFNRDQEVGRDQDGLGRLYMENLRSGLARRIWAKLPVYL